jgi:hypothetical protein
MESWTSRETSVSFDFFDRLVLWDIGIFLIEALGAFGDFTTGSVSGAGGSSAVISSAGGAMAVSLFGSSSSLQRKQEEIDFIQLKRKKANTTKSYSSQNTHESMKSKSSRSSSGTGASPAAVL